MSEQTQVIPSTETSSQPNQTVQKPEIVTPDVPSQKAPDDLAAKFAALAKKERFAMQQTKRVKQLEAQIAERERVIAERERLWDEEFKKSPLEAIKRRGYSYEDLTKAALNDGRFQPETEIKEVRTEIERLRQDQAAKEKKYLEDQQRASQIAEQEAIDTFKNNIKGHIETNNDKYELTNLYEAEELVFQTVEEHFLRSQKEGKPKIMSLDEACQLVESYLESEIERTATTSKKFQSKYQSLKAKEEKDIQIKSPSRTNTTLTNDLTPTSAAPSLLPVKTENERLQRAMAALNGGR